MAAHVRWCLATHLIATANDLPANDRTRAGRGRRTGTPGLAAPQAGFAVVSLTVDPGAAMIQGWGVDPVTSGMHSPDQSIENERRKPTLRPAWCNAA